MRRGRKGISKRGTWKGRLIAMNVRGVMRYEQVMVKGRTITI